MNLHQELSKFVTPIQPRRWRSAVHADVSSVAPVDASVQLSMHEVTIFSDERPSEQRPSPRPGSEDDASFEVMHTSGIGAASPSPFPEQRRPATKTPPIHPLVPRDANAAFAPKERVRVVLDHDTSLEEETSVIAALPRPTLSLGQARPRSPLQDVATLKEEVNRLRLVRQSLEAQLTEAREEGARHQRELSRLNNEFRDTSMSRDDREQKCLELNDMVDRLQRSMELERRRADDAEQQLAHTAEALRAAAAAPPPEDLRRTLHVVQKSADDAKKEAIAATRLVSSLKAQTAEYQAVLDRLGLRPPFDDALIASASVRLNGLQVMQVDSTVESSYTASDAPRERPSAKASTPQRAIVLMQRRQQQTLHRHHEEQSASQQQQPQAQAQLPAQLSTGQHQPQPSSQPSSQQRQSQQPHCAGAGSVGGSTISAGGNMFTRHRGFGPSEAEAANRSASRTRSASPGAGASLNDSGVSRSVRFRFTADSDAAAAQQPQLRQGPRPPGPAIVPNRLR
jgi:hypothetical protein